MSNEEKILEILVQMQQEQRVTNERLSKIEVDVSDLRAEMNDRFDSVELSIREAWKDIGIVEDRVDIHDTAIKKIM